MLQSKKRKCITNHQPKRYLQYIPKHIACWIPKSTNTHSEYVILIAFPLQQLLHEHIIMLYVLACLVLILTSHPMSRSAERFLSFWFPHQNPVWISLLPHVYHIPHSSHPTWFDFVLLHYLRRRRIFTSHFSRQWTVYCLAVCVCRVKKVHTLYFHIFAVHFLLYEPQSFIWGVLLYFWIFLLMFRSFYILLSIKICTLRSTADFSFVSVGC